MSSKSSTGWQGSLFAFFLPSVRCCYHLLRGGVGCQPPDRQPSDSCIVVVVCTVCQARDRSLRWRKRVPVPPLLFPAFWWTRGASCNAWNKLKIETRGDAWQRRDFVDVWRIASEPPTRARSSPWPAWPRRDDLVRMSSEDLGYGRCSSPREFQPCRDALDARFGLSPYGPRSPEGGKCQAR